MLYFDMGELLLLDREADIFGISATIYDFHLSWDVDEQSFPARRFIY